MLPRNKLIIGILFLLSACSNPTTLVPTVQPRPPVAIPVATPLYLNPVHFEVMNWDDLAKVLSEIKKTNSVLITLDPENYKNLTLNLTDITRYISEQRAINEFQQKIIDDQTQQVPKQGQKSGAN